MGPGDGGDEGNDKGEKKGRKFDPIYAPEQIDAKFKNIKVDGIHGKGPKTKAGTVRGVPNTKKKPLVEYKRVLSRYRKVAEKAIQTQNVPHTYRRRVGKYFDDLERVQASGSNKK